MDKNTIYGILAIVAIMVGWAYFTKPSEAELAARKRKADSLMKVQMMIQKDSSGKTIAINKNSKEAVVANDSTGKDTTMNHLKEAYSVFAGSAKGDDKFYTIENELLKIKISAKGGRIFSVQLKKYRTFDSLPLMLFDDKTSKFNFTFIANNRDISTDELFFKPVWSNEKFKDQNEMKISGNDSLTFSMRLYPDVPGDKKFIEMVYTIKGNSYLVSNKLNFIGLQDVVSPTMNYIHLDWKYTLNRQERNQENERNVSTIFYKPTSDDVENLSERKDAQESVKSSIKWISFKQQFFTSVLIADKSFMNADLSTQTETASLSSIKTMNAKIDLPFTASANQSIPLQFYFGPNKFKELKKLNLDLERQIPLGWGFLLHWINRLAVIPVFNFLEGFNLNYGIIILILTILLKIVLFPIAYKTYISSAKMRLLKPEIEEINKKFPKKDEAIKKQQALMGLYKKAGVNPLSGCVPMLLQLPILIALFRFFPASIELRQQSFLWAHDLSSYDSIYNLSFKIPGYGSHISLFTLLMTISTIIYTKLNEQTMPTNDQMPGMKAMPYIMSIMFLGIFNNYACGLSYYYFLANVITFAQMWAFKMIINEDKLHKQIQENKLKPVSVKKSGFQKRLEDIAKQKGYKPKK